MVTAITATAQSITVVWDHSPDPGVVKYNMYSRTNGVANTNFFQVGTVNFPTNTIVITPPAGQSASYYVTAQDAEFIESDPSNILDWFQPIGVPPANVLLTKTIASYNPTTKVWSNVSLTWPQPDVKYGVTNFTVVAEGATSTNKVTTSSTSYTFATLARGDYKIYVLSTNSLGASPLTVGTVWALSGTAPKGPTFLRTQ